MDGTGKPIEWTGRPINELINNGSSRPDQASINGNQLPLERSKPPAVIQPPETNGHWEKERTTQQPFTTRRTTPRIEPVTESTQNSIEPPVDQEEVEEVTVSIINPGFVETPLTAANQFDMPALLTPQQAASAILQGWARGAFEIHFPKRFTLWLKALRIMPNRLFFQLVRRVAL